MAEGCEQNLQGPLIVIDGAVDLPCWLEGAPGARVVSNEVWVGEEPFVGSSERFWSIMRSGTYPSTCPPTVSALAGAYGYPDLVFAIHVSGGRYPCGTPSLPTSANGEASSIQARSLVTEGGWISASELHIHPSQRHDELRQTL